MGDLVYQRNVTSQALKNGSVDSFPVFADQRSKFFQEIRIRLKFCFGHLHKGIMPDSLTLGEIGFFSVRIDLSAKAFRLLGLTH